MDFIKFWNFLIFFDIFSSTLTLTNSYKNSVLNYVVSPILKKTDLKFCKRFIVHDHDTHFSKDLEINFQDTLSSFIQEDSLTNLENIYLINLLSSNSSRFGLVNTLGNFRKVGKNCGSVLIFLENSKISEKLGQIFNLLMNGQFAPTRKDEDYYIILKREEGGGGNDDEKDLEKILLSRQMGKVKYKIGLNLKPILLNSPGKAEESHLDQIIQINVKTVCFYCGLGATPKIINFYISNWTRFEDFALFPDFVKNFNNYQLVISCPTRVPFGIEIEKVEDNKYVAVRGLYKYVLDELGSQLNFSYGAIAASRGGGTGVIVKGNWTGVIYDIIEENAHLGAVNGLIVSRFSVSSHSFSTSYEWLTFTTKIPKVFFSWQALFWSFTVEVWIWIFVSTGLTIIILWWIIKMELNPTPASLSLSLSTIALKVNNKKRNSIPRVAEYVIGNLLEEGIKDDSNGSSGRILCAFSLVVNVILSVAYRSKLVSNLGFPITLMPPGTFKALSINPNFMYGMEGGGIGGAAEMILKSSTNPTYKKIYRLLDNEPITEKCFYRGVSEDYACIVWQNMANYMIFRNFSDKFGRISLTVAKDGNSFISVGYVMEIRAIFRTNLNNYIMAAMDTGLLNKWEKIDFELVRKKRIKWEKQILMKGLNKKKNGEEELDDGTIILKLENFKGAFYMYLILIIISFLVISFEIVYIKKFKFYYKQYMFN